MCAGTSTPRGPRKPLHPQALARFVDALPIPRVLSPEAEPRDARAASDPAQRIDRYRIAMRESEVRVHRDMPATRMWGYAGEVPGPTVEAREGRALSVEWANDLPPRHLLPIDLTLHGAHGDQPEVRTVVHVHGARVPPESDGFPESWFPAGQSLVSHYPNRQAAATLWYHDHAMGIERLNHYSGLFGFYLIRDDLEDALALPSGPHEVPLVLFDRLFNEDGQLHYPTSGDPQSPWVPEVYGDALLVNGKLYPYFDVEPRPYRFRILNASNARFYDLSLSDRRPLHQIGADQGLLASPAAQSTIALAPAERADVVVDFSGARGEAIALMNQTAPMMQFRVGTGPSGASRPLPKQLRPLVRIPESAAVKTRTLTLDEYEDPKTRRMLMLLNGTYWRQPVTESPELDSCEIWSFVNLTEDAHPIHLHLVRFQVLDRQAFDADEFRVTGEMNWRGPRIGPRANEGAWKDTVLADPGFVTRIIIRFEGYKGRYVWHCHVLEHSANEMMRPFDVVPAR